MNKHIWRLGLIVLICLLSHRASAQKTRGGDSPRRDTVFVYDTLFVTDTVWLPHPGKQHHRLLPTLPPLQPEGFALGSPSKTLIFFSGNTATLANSDIIDSVNIIHLKNTDTMKKIGFFGVVFLAFQHMVLSQNHVTLNSGLAIKARGGVLDGDVVQDWGVRAFSINDPDGFKLTFMTPVK